MVYPVPEDLNPRVCQRCGQRHVAPRPLCYICHNSREMARGKAAATHKSQQKSQQGARNARK